jgi:tetratricopeptide (TPR) repeat protein
MNFYSNLYFPRDRLKAGMLLLVTIALYVPFLGNPLVFDDVPFFKNALWFFADAPFEFGLRWFPYSSMGVTWVFFGEAPYIYRAQNLLLHGMNVLMLLLVLRLWIGLFIEEVAAQKMANWGAWLGALVFACHPLAVYGVGYLVQRSILMATLFTLLMHLAYFRGMLEGNRRFMALAVAAYFLAVFSKEHGLLVPAILLPMTWLLRERIKLPMRALLLTWIGFAVIATIVVMRTKGLLGQVYEKDAAALLEQEGILKGMPMLHLLSVLSQAGLFFKYCLLMLVPNPAWMSIDMRETFIMDWRAWESWSGLVAYLAYGAGALWCMSRGGRMTLFGLALLYPWSIFPLEFASVRVQEIFVLYRAYLWLPGFMLLIPLVCSGLSVRKIMLAGAVCMVVLMPMAWNRLVVFSDTYKLWDDAVQLLHGEDRLGAHRTYFNRAQASSVNKSWDAAIADYRKSLAINSSYPEVTLMLGSVLNNAQHFQEAIVEFDKVIVLQPDNASAYYAKGFALRNLNDNEGAMRNIQKSCDLGLNMACIIAGVVNGRKLNSSSAAPPQSP